MINHKTYIKIFEGTNIEVLKIKNILNKKNISPIIKDNAESARLAGFGNIYNDFKEVYVHKDQIKMAKEILNKF
tara:strand:- start:635 stop:856 length:222 start_codon:yes stop_codon:yes gene_type:complete